MSTADSQLLVPAFLLLALVIYIVSKVDKEPSKNVIDEFEKVESLEKEENLNV